MRESVESVVQDWARHPNTEVLNPASLGLRALHLKLQTPPSTPCTSNHDNLWSMVVVILTQLNAIRLTTTVKKKTLNMLVIVIIIIVVTMTIAIIVVQIY